MSYYQTAKALDETIAKHKEVRLILEDLKFSGVSRALEIQLWIKRDQGNDLRKLVLSNRNNVRDQPKVMAGMDMIILGLRKYYEGVSDRQEAEEARLRNVLASEVKS